MKVVFFQRKPVINKQFSIEILFNQIRANLPKEIVPETRVAKYFSKGFFRRLYISFEACFNQGQVNHVTGDINFISIFLKKRKTVLTLLDLRIFQHPNPVYRKLLMLFWVKLPIRMVGYVTTISAATKNTLLNNVKVDPDKIRVMYIPVADLMEYTPKEFNENNVNILQIGTKKNKNLLRLIEAIKDIDCKLEIVGQIDEEQLTALKLNNIKYSNCVGISNEELKQKYIDADILAFVSTLEGFGMPIVEAQIVGRPVITSNLLSMPEVAGKGAHIVDPYNVEEIRDGLLKIISDKEYRESIVESGRTNAERFSVETITEQYANLYREIYESSYS